MGLEYFESLNAKFGLTSDPVPMPASSTPSGDLGPDPLEQPPVPARVPKARPGSGTTPAAAPAPADPLAYFKSLNEAYGVTPAPPAAPASVWEPGSELPPEMPGQGPQGGAAGNSGLPYLPSFAAPGGPPSPSGFQGATGIPTSEGVPQIAGTPAEYGMTALNAAGRGVNYLQQQLDMLDLAMNFGSDPQSKARLMADYIQQGKEAEMYPRSPRVQRMVDEVHRASQAGDWGGVIRGYYKNPELLLDLTAESAPAMIPSAVAGIIASAATGGAAPLIGYAAGSFGGQLMVEYPAAIIDFLHDKKGVDLSDGEQLKAALNDPQIMHEARKSAAVQGTLRAGIEAAGNLVAPGLVRGASRPFRKTVEGVAGSAETFLSRATGIAAGAGIGPVAGAAGEAAAEVAVGDPLNPEAIGGEFFGEFIPGGIETALAVRAGGHESGTRSFEKPGIGDFGPEARETVATPDEAVAQGRTEFAFDDGSGNVEVSDYDSAEATMAERGGHRKGRLIAVKPEDVVTAVDEQKLHTVKPTSFIGVTAEPVTRTTQDGTPVVSPEAAADVATLEAATKVAARTRANSPERANVVNVIQETLAKGNAQLAGGPAKLVGLMSRTFKGPTRNLAVAPRQVLQAGLDVQAATPGALLNSTRTSDFDVDLNKIQPGDIIPGGTENYVKAYQVLGENRFRRALVDAGNAPEVVDEVVSTAKGSASTSLFNMAQDGVLKPPTHPAFYRNHAYVANNPESAARVDGAKVKRIKVQGVSPDIADKGLDTEAASTFRAQHGADIRLTIDPKFIAPPRAMQMIGASVKVMQEIMQKFNIPIGFDLVFSGFPVGRTHWAGFYSRAKGVIAINVENYGNASPEGTYSTIFHEFGHFLHAAGIMMMNVDDRMKVYAAYRRYVLSVAAGKIPDISASSSATFQAPTTASVLGDPNGYSLSFEEWFAEQVARWALTNRRPLGFMAKITRPVVKMLREAAKGFAKADPTNQMQAEVEIEQMFARTLKGEVKGEYAGSIEADTDTATRLENERDTHGEDLGPMSPRTIQTVDIRKMFEGLGETNVSMESAKVGQTQTSTGLRKVLAQADRFNWFYNIYLTVIQLAKINPHIQPLQMYREMTQRAHQEVSKIMTGAQTRLQEWRALGRAQAEALGQFLFDVDNMNYRTPAEILANVVRQPTNAELLTLAQKYKMNREAVQMFKNVRADFQGVLARYTQQLLGEAQKITDPTEQAARIKEINGMFNNLQKRPYFPHTRYGKWTLTVREGKRLELFETYETKSELKAANRRAMATYPAGAGFRVQMGVLQEGSQALMGVPPQMLDLMAKTLKLSTQQMADFEQLKFELSPAQSFKKRFMKRSDIAGYSEDAQRNYAHYFFHHAKHYMRVKWQGPLSDQVSAIHALKSVSGNDATKIGRIGNYVQEHLNEMLNPKADMAALRSVAAVWYLGFNPKSAVLNLTQLAIATTPFLSGKFGDLRTMNAMRQVALDVRRFYSAGKMGGMTPEEFKAVGVAVEEGLLDESQAAELAALAEGSKMLGMLPAKDVRKRWIQFSNMSMLLFQATEKYNRRVTFRAAWRLAMEDPNNKWVQSTRALHPLMYQDLINKGFQPKEAAAYVAAKEATESTQFQYAKWAKPRFMRGRLGSVFMFHLFTQNMLFLMGNNKKDVMPRMLITMMLLGGMMGLPGAEDLDDIVKALAAQFLGKDFDIEREARRAVIDVTDDKFAADVLLRGISRTSFGIPQVLDAAGITSFPQFDMSASVGLGRALPVNPAILFNDPGLQTEKAMQTAITDAAGAVYSIGFNVWQASNDSSTPFFDPRRWERAMPSSARNASRAFRYGMEGGEVLRSGETVAKFDMHDPEQVAEVIGQGLGFTPTKLAQAWDLRRAKAEVTTYWTTRRTMLMDQAFTARRNQDSDAYREVRENISEFNQSVPDPTFRITGDSLNKSSTRRLRNIHRKDQLRSPTRSGSRVVRELNELYPNALDVRPVD